jgi:hypothetical protein
MAFTRMACVAVAALWATGAAAAELALKRVVLSTGGVALYEYETEVAGDATVELKVRLDQVDDVLKSLVVFDDEGGVGGLDLASAEPLSETFRDLPFSQADLQSTPQLMTALRGAEVEVGGPHTIAGRIVSVSEETETKPDGGTLGVRHRIGVMSDKGLEQFILEQADSVRFADPAVRDEIARALKAVAASGERDSRALRLLSRGSATRKLHVAYLAAAPVWKASYRLVLDPAPDAAKGTLQGWATLENLSGQDWKDVDLTLVSGRPVAYRQALYRAYMIDRPEAPLDVGATLTPEIDNGAMAAPTPTPSPALDRPAPPLAKALARAENLGVTHSWGGTQTSAVPGLAAGAEAVAGQEGVTQVSFHIPFAVNVDNGRTLSLPIIDAPEPVRRVAIFDAQTDTRHPLSAAELTNDGKASLPPGIVTIYENGADGASFVGDARLSGTPAGEKRLLSFALDRKTTVEEDDSDASTLVRARIAKGVLTVEDLWRRRTVYRVQASEPRRLVVAVPKMDGAKLTEPGGADVAEAEGRYRVPFDVKSGEQSFAVAQERTDTRAIALAGLDDADLGVYAHAGEIDAQTRASLARLGDLRAAQAEAERALTDTRSRIEAVVADQNRLKGLLGAVASGSDLSKRYLAKLDADETELERRRADLDARQKARDDAKKAVAAFVAGL